MLPWNQIRPRMSSEKDSYYVDEFSRHEINSSLLIWAFMIGERRTTKIVEKITVKSSSRDVDDGMIWATGKRVVTKYLVCGSNNDGLKLNELKALFCQFSFY